MQPESVVTDRLKIDRLLETFPDEMVHRVLDFTESLHLHRLSQTDLQYSDEWTEEDLRDWAKSGFEHMEKTCPWQDGGGEVSDAAPR